jgi:type I restriction enzyme S subunit
MHGSDTDHDRGAERMSLPRYPEYKDSGVEWLGDVPTHWIKRNLQDTAIAEKYSFVDGPFGSDLKNEEYSENGVPLIQLNNIAIGTHNLESLKFVPIEKANQLKKHNAFPGDIVIAKMADPVARAAIVSSDYDQYLIVADCVRLTVNRVSWNVKFVQYWINSPSINAIAETLSGGITRIRINLGALKKLPIFQIPLEEQDAIAAFLDCETGKIDALIAEQQRLVELLAEKRQAVISHAVTKGLNSNVPMKDSGIEWLGEVPEHWEVWKLSHAFGVIGSGTTPKSDNTAYYDGGETAWVNTGDLKDGELLNCEKRVTDLALAENSSLKIFPAGSLVIAMYGATIGKLAILRFPSTVNQACCVFVEGTRVQSIFLFYWFLGLRQQLISLATGGGQPNISQEILRGLRLACPSHAEQCVIATFLDTETEKFNTLTAEANLAIALLQERRSTLISAAVTGKIDVREAPNKERDTA